MSALPSLFSALRQTLLQGEKDGSYNASVIASALDLLPGLEHEYEFDVNIPLAEQREEIARLRKALGYPEFAQ